MPSGLAVWPLSLSLSLCVSLSRVLPVLAPHLALQQWWHSALLSERASVASRGIWDQLSSAPTLSRHNS